MSRHQSLLSALALAALLIPATSPTQAGGVAGQPRGGSVIQLRLHDDRIVESSGLTLSSRHQQVLLTHNDSGDSARVFAVGRRGGTLAVWTLPDAVARDWEDIAVGRRHTVWVADIGDNSRSRDTIQLYRFREPRRLSSRRVRSTTFRLDYRDGRHDAETLLVHPRTGRVLVVTKESGSAGFYAAPRRLHTGRVNHLRRVRSAPDVITAGDFSHRAGSKVVLRNYGRAFLYRGVQGAVTSRDLPPARQAESITWGPRDHALLTGSEGGDSPVWRVPVG